MGYVPEEEPFKKLINQGHIQGRSNFVYRLTNFGSDGEGDLTNIKNIYVSKGLYTEFKRNFAFQINIRRDSISVKMDELTRSASTEFLFRLKETIFSSTDGVKSISLFANSFVERHVDVNIVDNDILDLEKFKKSSSEYANADFILEDGKYICGVEIEKMSKSKYNVVNPDVLVDRYGADTLRLYEMFLGPLEQSKPWNTNGVEGVSKFLRKFWKLYHDEGNNFAVSDAEATKAEWKSLHKIIKKAEEDIERFSFNTSVSSFMICVNELSDLKCNKRQILEPLAVVISPYAPHITEELWHLLGHKNSISFATFPTFKPEYLVENEFNYPISFNGKVRTNISMPLDLSNEDIEKQVLADEHVQKQLDGKSPKKIIVVKGRIVNVVI